jgi:6-phosphogluconolactonase (cycloisomerase 2 family)
LFVPPVAAQSDPHLHAIVLDPIFGRVAYVPDLGADCVRQVRHYDSAKQSKHARRPNALCLV